MEKKIRLAMEYAEAHGNTLEAVNDASNIYADNYEEYEYIFCSIGKPYISQRFYGGLTMDQKRFYYSHSHVYGWCVYDRQTNTPAYEACADLLPPVRQDESGTTMESPVMLENEYKAMRLCSKLNVTWKRYCNSK